MFFIDFKTLDGVVLDGDASGVALDIAESPHHHVLVQVSGDGNRVTIGGGCKLEAKIFVANGAHVWIGSKVTAFGIYIIAHEGSDVRIGDGCLLSNNVIFRPSDPHKIFDLASGERVNRPEPIELAERVWVGEQTSFLKGSYIASDSVVGTRSLVTRRFNEPNCVIGGIPARVLRRNIRWAP